jgi:signal recognition particle receptor subunit beta
MAAPPLSLYLATANAIVFIIDAADRETFFEARRMFENLLSIDGIRGIPVLILANKIDKPYAASPDELRSVMSSDEEDMERVQRDRVFGVVFGSATMGYGEFSTSFCLLSSYMVVLVAIWT